MTPLCKLALRHGTDKHRYSQIYDSVFKDRRSEVESVLEIGIHEGASLRMWAEYFPNAQVFGIDVNPYTMISGEPRIRTFIGNQADPDSLRRVAGAMSFDLIVDDGSHKPKHQVPAALTLLPFLKSSGCYVIEDVHRYPKPDGPDDPSGIMQKMPKEYDCRLIRTGPRDDDVMIWMNWK